MPDHKKMDQSTLLDLLFKTSSNPQNGAEHKEAPVFEPLFSSDAKPQVGSAKCPMCDTAVAVFLTRQHRPYFRCGYCSVFVFFNGREGIERLQRQMTPMSSDTE